MEKCDGGVRLVKREQFVPFGFGRRVCMGEALAKDTLLIFFATLVKQLRSFVVVVFALVAVVFLLWFFVAVLVGDNLLCATLIK